jgi:hypothetical protein
MTGTANAEASTKMEISPVLQGGGALGAYRWGAISALLDVVDEASHNGRDITLRVDKANAYKLVKLIEISLTADAVSDDPNGFRDFPREGIVGGRNAGRRIALSALRTAFHSQLAA